MALFNVGSATSTGAVGAGQKTGAKKDNGLGSQDFLNLLITQLRNQNPLEPVGGTEFLSQTAQFSQVEALNKLNTNLSQLLSSQQLTQASSLIGKKVSYQKDGATTPLSGVVSAINVTDGKVQLTAGTDTVDLSSVRSIQAA